MQHHPSIQPESILYISMRSPFVHVNCGECKMIPLCVNSYCKVDICETSQINICCILLWPSISSCGKVPKTAQYPWFGRTKALYHCIVIFNLAIKIISVTGCLHSYSANATSFIAVTTVAQISFQFAAFGEVNWCSFHCMWIICALSLWLRTLDTVVLLPVPHYCESLACMLKINNSSSHLE